MLRLFDALADKVPGLPSERAVFLSDRVDDIEVVVDLGRAEYRAGASLPPTASFPSSFGAPNFAVIAFKVSMDFNDLPDRACLPHSSSVPLAAP